MTALNWKGNIQTRDGLPARLIGTLQNDLAPYVVGVTTKTGEIVIRCEADGRVSIVKEHGFDIVQSPEVERIVLEKTP